MIEYPTTPDEGFTAGADASAAPVDSDLPMPPKVKQIVQAGGNVVPAGIMGSPEAMLRYMATGRGVIRPSGNHPSPEFTDC